MFNSNDKVRVVKFVAIETGTYNPIFERPFQTNVRGDLHREVLSRLDPSRPYTPTVFSDIAPEFIAPSAVPGREVAVTGGWQERRLRWVLQLEWITSFGTREIQILTGYTDPMQLSYNGRMDPRAQLYVNNSFMFRLQTENTPTGVVTRMVPNGGGQIMINNNYAGIFSNTPQHLARPSDVILVNALNPYELQAIGDQGMTVTNAVVTNDAKISTRNNANPANYMNRLLEASRRSIMENVDIGQSHEDVVLAAQRNSADKSSRADKFLSTLRNINQANNYGNTFTHDQLRLIDPNIDQVTHVRTLNDVQRNQSSSVIPIHQVGQTQHWQGSDIHTQIATTLANAVPGIMTDNAISSISVMFSNRDGGNLFVPSVSRVNSFIDNLDMSVFIQNFVNRTTAELLNSLSHNHALLLELVVHCDIIGDTRLEIAVNGERVDYALPTFCDALYSPVLQQDLEGVTRIAHSFGQLMDDSYSSVTAKYSFDASELSQMPIVGDLRSALDTI